MKPSRLPSPAQRKRGKPISASARPSTTKFIPEVENLLSSCHGYMTKHGLLRELPAETYKTDFAEGYETALKLDKILNEAGGSLEYSEVLMHGCGNEHKKLYPVYYPSWHYAKANDELPLWKESFKINKECRDFINANASHAYHDHKLPDFVTELTETYGLERSMFVTARFVMAADWDGRYGKDVKERAALVNFQDMKDAGTDIKSTSHDRTSELYSNVHPCMLDSIFRSMMKMEQQQVNIPQADACAENEHDEGDEQ